MSNMISFKGIAQRIEARAKRLSEEHTPPPTDEMLCETWDALTDEQQYHLVGMIFVSSVLSEKRRDEKGLEMIMEMIMQDNKLDVPKDVPKDMKES